MTERNPADVLEPCPFCGHDVKLVDRKELFVFSCPDHSPCIGVGFATYGKQDQRETAIAAWNTRAALQQSRSAITDADLSDSVLAPIVKAMYGNELSHDCDVEGLRRIYRAIQAALSQESADV